MNKTVHVAVGVVIRNHSEVLIAFRSQDKHQGGLWEFPGGKVEQDETVQQALCRELKEEINLDVLESSQIMEIKHDYGDKKVKLDVWKVTAFDGKESGKENQPIRWVAIADIQSIDFPLANRPIVEYLTSLAVKP